MCWEVGGGASVAGWLPAGGIRASQGMFSSLILGYPKINLWISNIQPN